MGPGSKVLIIAGFLVTGSINTLTKKWQFQTCGPSDESSRDCPPGEKPFHKPWTQNIQMFVGESLLIGLFLAKRRAHPGESRGRPTPFYIFCLPACCDILGTGIGGVGMLYISASVWQMMRGSLIIFTSMWSLLFLKKKLYLYNWTAVLISACGLMLVGISAVLDEGGGESSNVPIGILLTIISQMFAAFQMVVEEWFVKGYNATPERVVGCEGLWGVAIMCVVLAVMYVVPGNDSGSYENVVDSLHMLAGSGQLLLFVLCYLVSISFFNFLGVTISGKLSAVHRTINDALRTCIIWAVEILVYYVIGSERYGTAWQPHSWLQLIGFFLLILGNLVNHKILRLPFLDYTDEQLAGSASDGLSLVDAGISNRADLRETEQ